MAVNKLVIKLVRAVVSCCSDDDAKTNVTRLKHSGMPPVTPQACVKDNITGAAFDFIWAEVSQGNTHVLLGSEVYLYLLSALLEGSRASMGLCVGVSSREMI